VISKNAERTLRTSDSPPATLMKLQNTRTVVRRLGVITGSELLAEVGKTILDTLRA
jgi:hypothetical protein